MPSAAISELVPLETEDWPSECPSPSSTSCTDLVGVNRVVTPGYAWLRREEFRFDVGEGVLRDGASSRPDDSGDSSL